VYDHVTTCELAMFRLLVLYLAGSTQTVRGNTNRLWKGGRFCIMSHLVQIGLNKNFGKQYRAI